VVVSVSWTRVECSPREIPARVEEASNRVQEVEATDEGRCSILGFDLTRVIRARFMQWLRASSSNPPSCRFPARPLSPFVMAAAAVSEPGQCSLYFDPKQWSKRYEETFFTCLVAGHLVRDGTPAFVVQLHAGALNSWQVTHTAAEFEAFAAKVAAELHARQDATAVPELPAKKFSLISEDTSAEHLAQRTGE
jgi:hypothetical protein